MNKQLLDLYSDYLICQNQYSTATGLSALTNGEVSHDKVTRFLREEDYGSKELWGYVKSDVRQHEKPSGGVLILDDTIEEKPYTDENEVVAWHHSHAKNRHVKGIGLLSCLVRYGDISLPISYEVIKKDIVFSDLKTKKLKKKSSVSKNILFQNMLAQAAKNEVLFDYVLADNWFGSKANLKFIHYDLKKKFIIGLKSNRLAALSAEAKDGGQFQQVNSLDMKDGEHKLIWLKDQAFPVQLLKKVFTNEDNSTGVLYLVTNDLSIDADHLYEVYQKRWRIEEYHKSIKQNASLAKSPAKTVRTQCNHVFASIIAYCKLELLKVKTAMNHFAIKYKLILKANQAMLQEFKKMTAS